jgi:hypothetical protein
MKPWTPYLLATATLAGCVTYTANSSPDGLVRAAIGQTVYADGPRVTPLAVLEDSRCPADVDCAWAGQVRLSVRVNLGSRSQTMELTSHRPVRVADGTLELVEVLPARNSKAAISGRDYRFAFRFMGGL